MGAWGEGALDSDQALDWLGANVTDDVGLKIENLLDRFNRAYRGDADRGVEEFAYSLRAAAFVVTTLNFFSNWTRYGDLHEGLAVALRKVVRNKAWMEGWADPNKVSESLSGQINDLEQGMRSTTLLDNLGA